MQRKRLWLALFLALLAVAYALFIFQVYQNPPLFSSMTFTRTDPETDLRRVGITMDNRGRRALVLTGARLNGATEVAGWTSHSAHVAANLAILPEHWPTSPHTVGPVEGLWVDIDCKCPQDSWAVSFLLPPTIPAGNYEAEVQYRYLGWPFTYRKSVEIP